MKSASTPSAAALTRAENHHGRAACASFTRTRFQPAANSAPAEAVPLALEAMASGAPWGRLEALRTALA